MSAVDNELKILEAFILKNRFINDFCQKVKTDFSIVLDPPVQPERLSSHHSFSNCDSFKRIDLDKQADKADLLQINEEDKGSEREKKSEDGEEHL